MDLALGIAMWSLIPIFVVLFFVGSVAILKGRPWVFPAFGRLGFLVAFTLTYAAIYAYMVVSRIQSVQPFSVVDPQTLAVTYMQPQIALVSVNEGQFLLTGLFAGALALRSTDAARQRINWRRTVGSAVLLVAWVIVLFTSPATRLSGWSDAMLTLPLACLLGAVGGGVLSSRNALRDTVMCHACGKKTPAYLGRCRWCKEPIPTSESDLAVKVDFSEEWPDRLTIIRDEDPDEGRRVAAERELRKRGLT